MSTDAIGFLTDEVEITPGTWTANTWTDVFAAAGVPTDATGLIVEYVRDTTSSGVVGSVAVRLDSTHGINTDLGNQNKSVACETSGGTDVETHGIFFVGLDTDGDGTGKADHFEVYAGATGVAEQTLWCRGWFGPDVKWVVPTAKSPTADGAWQDLDITSLMGGDAGNANAVIVKVRNANAKDTSWCLRENGGTRSALLTMAPSSTCVIVAPLDSNDIFEGYTAAGVDFYVLGYVLDNGNLVMNTEHDTAPEEKTVTVAAGDTLLDVTDATASGALMALVVHTNSWDDGATQRWDHPDVTASVLKGYTSGHMMFPVGMNSSGEVEYETATGAGTLAEVWGYVPSDIITGQYAIFHHSAGTADGS